MTKPHPRTKEILIEMEKWAKEEEWPNAIYLLIEEAVGFKDSDGDYLIKLVLREGSSIGPLSGKFLSDIHDTLHFIPRGCDSDAKYAYCAIKGSGKVVKHKIGGCSLAKERRAEDGK